MDHRLRIIVRIGLAIASVAVLALVGCSGGGAPSSGGSGSSGSTATDGQALFEERCSVCHPTSRALQTQKDRQGWESTVERMRGHGAQLSDQEAAAVVEYLAAKNGGQ